MVCSRSGVRLYAATPHSGPGLLCAAARFVSAKKATMAARGGRADFFIFLECCGMNSYFLVTRSFSPHRWLVTFLNFFFSAGRVRVHPSFECYNQRGYIRTWYAYQHFLFDFPFDEIYRHLLFFTLLAVRGVHIISSSKIKPENSVLLYT